MQIKERYGFSFQSKNPHSTATSHNILKIRIILSAFYYLYKK